jgi:hypothetical protein
VTAPDSIRWMNSENGICRGVAGRSMKYKPADAAVSRTTAARAIRKRGRRKRGGKATDRNPFQKMPVPGRSAGDVSPFADEPVSLQAERGSFR